MPPVDNEVPKTTIKPLGRVFVALGMFDMETMPIIAAEVIDHTAPFEEAPPQGTTAEYGQYLMSITMCAYCHGANMRGAPPLEEGAPPGPNIVVYSAADGWSEEQFASTVRTGVTPYGKSLNPEWMPWDIFMKMTDEELAAIWRYIRSLSSG